LGDNNEVEDMWKRSDGSLIGSSSLVLKEMRKTVSNPSQDGRHPGRNSKQAAPKYNLALSNPVVP
jgi:hypothetical protein